MCRRDHDRHLERAALMGCGDRPTPLRLARRRAYLRGLVERDAAAGARHRLSHCTHATDCGRLCERLVKAPGKALVWCVDFETGDRTPLYESLARPEFHCPRGRF